MIDTRKVWIKPVFQVLGDVQTLTRQSGPPGPPCPPPVMKGHGTGDTFSNSQTNDPNDNNGCIGDGLASGL